MIKILLGIIFSLYIPFFISEIGTLKINQVELCQTKNKNSSASTYSAAFSNQFSGCKIELSRR